MWVSRPAYDMTQEPLVNFMVPKDNVADLDMLRNGDVDRLWELFGSGRFCWTLQTYLILKRMSGPYRYCLSCDYREDAINIVHPSLSERLGPTWKHFVVSAQADRPRNYMAHFHIVQNKAQEDLVSAYVPLWPQANLIRRDSRREHVENVAFAGLPVNTELAANRIEHDLGPMGLKFVGLNQKNWNDLSKVDILMGVRSFSKKAHYRKPPSKLINAWHAGIPFVGGYDSAFSQVGVPGEDYIRVLHYEEMLAELRRLMADRQYYLGFVANGYRKTSTFTRAAIARQWISILERRVIPRFQDWLNSGCRQGEYRKRWLHCRLVSYMRSAVNSSYRFRCIKELRDRLCDPKR
jgi:hypothetical protein